MSSKEETYRSVGRKEIHMIPTEELTLVTDPNHELYDEHGVHGPLKPGLVENIANCGIKKPIIIRINGKDKKGKNILEIVDGRHRYRATVLANKELKKNGIRDLVMVPCLPEKGNIEDAISTMIMTNEFHHEATIVNRAKKSKKLIDRGIDIKDVANNFGVHPTTIGNWQKLLRCCKEVLDAVEQDKLPVTAALPLADLADAAQKKALHEMLSASTNGVIKGRAAVSAAQNAANGKRARPSNGSTQRMRSRAFGEKLKELLTPGERDDDDDDRFDVAYEMTDFFMGNDDAFKKFPEMKQLVKSLLEKKIKAEKKPRAKQEAETVDL